MLDAPGNTSGASAMGENKTLHHLLLPQLEKVFVAFKNIRQPLLCLANYFKR